MSTSPPSPTPLAWLRPVDTDPPLLVDRIDEAARLEFWLTDALGAERPDQRILLTGERGSGKSILARAVLAKLRDQFPDRVVAVELRGRSLVYRTLLERLAQELAKAARRRLSAEDDYHESLDQLEMLGRHSQITNKQVEGTSRRAGVSGKLAGDALVVKLESAFTWERSFSAGQEVGRSAQVTETLLHDAITQVLADLADRDITALILFDDLDQASTATEASAVLSLVQSLLELRPCLALVHLRTEALVDNVRREIDRSLELTPLPPAAMMEMLDRRLELWAAAKREHEPPRRLPLDGSRAALGTLAGVVANPLVFLRWVGALLQEHGLPLPQGWSSPTALERASAAQPVGVDRALLRRLVELVDRCALEPEHVWCRREDLARGGKPLDPAPVRGLSEAELELLIDRAEVLLPRNRFEAPPLYRVDPVLDLLRPSVQARLRT